MEIEELENVNWQRFFHDPRRVAHEVSGLEPIPLELDDNTEVTVQEHKLQQQKTLRLKIMANLAREIYSIDELMER